MRCTIAVAFAASALSLLASAEAGAQGFYPREWLQGRSGLFAPDYITPSEDRPGYVTGRSGTRRRGTKMIFAAASVDQRCQQDGSPQVDILSAPRAGRIEVDLGRFVATGLDGGAADCLGRPVRGTRVFYRGRAAAGDQVVLRVAYPTRGVTYQHVIPVR